MGCEERMHGYAIGMAVTTVLLRTCHNCFSRALELLYSKC